MLLINRGLKINLFYTFTESGLLLKNFFGDYIIETKKLTFSKS